MISFILIAAAVYFFIVLPMNTLLARMRRGEAGPDPTTKKMPRVPQRNTYRGTTLRFLHLPAHRSHDALRDIVSRTFISISIVSACGPTDDHGLARTPVISTTLPASFPP